MVFIIATIGQIFCGAAGLTSASRTWYAFSRDRGMPGLAALPPGQPRPRAVQRRDRRLRRVALIIAIPAFFGDEQHPVRVLRDHGHLHGRPLPGLHHPGVPAAAGGRRRSSPGRGTWAPLQAGEHRWRSLFVVARRSYALNLPFTPAGLPWDDEFDVERRELHAARDRPAADLRRLVPGLGQGPLPRSGAHARGGRGHGRRRERQALTLKDLQKAHDEGTVDTVLLVLVDMEGRLQGKRMTAPPLPRRGRRARRRGLQLPARGRRRHEHGRRLRDVDLGARATATS